MSTSDGLPHETTSKDRPTQVGARVNEKRYQSRSVSEPGALATGHGSAPSLALRALILQITGIDADIHNATAHDDIQPQFARSGNQRRTFRAGIKPHLSNGFSSDLFDDLEPDLGRQIEARAIQPIHR